jgi:transglutaminase-like putative cysteine protease
VNTPLPGVDEKTDAALLYSETNVTVVSTASVKTTVREAYKILRPSGREHGTLTVYYRSPGEKVINSRGWCIPAQGKDFEVTEKDAVDMAPPFEGGILVTDVRARVIHIPAPDPGNIVGYEYEVDENPLVLKDEWRFQGTDPVRESHYSLTLPPNWEYKSSWMNHPEVKPVQVGGNQWQWTVADIKSIRREEDMPPWQGIAGQMILTYYPAGGATAKNVFSDWQGMGIWYTNLLNGRLEASEQIKQEVAALTANKATTLEKMQALAGFVQHDIRYVAVELGIGGWQPHPASDTFQHRYGDCKDKATLLRSMLREIGVESYHVAINTRRGSITSDTPANNGFNHVITAIKLPDGLQDPSLMATLQLPDAGRVLFFDPTDQLTPFGRIRGPLQSNYALVVTGNGGQLVKLPEQPLTSNSVQRTAKFSLDTSGGLTGEVKEVRVGDRANVERWRLQTVTDNKDRIKPIEEILSGSLSSFQITHAGVVNLEKTDLPLGFNYAFASENYAKNAGDLVLLRPRVLGVKAQGILETKEPRRYPIEFEGPVKDEDTFEIALPAGYKVDDLPPPVDADYSFASYHSKTQAEGNVIRYTRTFEVKELSVPVEKSEELKTFYREIATDERNTAVLKAK